MEEHPQEKKFFYIFQNFPYIYFSIALHLSQTFKFLLISFQFNVRIFLHIFCVIKSMFV